MSGQRNDTTGRGSLLHTGGLGVQQQTCRSKACTLPCFSASGRPFDGRAEGLPQGQGRTSSPPRGVAAIPRLCLEESLQPEGQRDPRGLLRKTCTSLLARSFPLRPEDPVQEIDSPPPPAKSDLVQRGQCFLCDVICSVCVGRGRVAIRAGQLVGALHAPLLNEHRFVNGINLLPGLNGFYNSYNVQGAVLYSRPLVSSSVSLKIQTSWDEDHVPCSHVGAFFTT
ncbi:hypothetical protein GWK47_006904 [Chionoecetes opilio]|uniref:Uncharacterized protein n=1 Tax=Chionoecetes opilio TaxID=41210 RepID=A0A8J4YF54_CHIOP|nr:hypothetical protein GWK47_006904 [Chionoecetes opilio]